MPRPRRENLHRLQAHALSDALGLCSGDIPLKDNFDAEWSTILCPLCIAWFRLDALDEDHAPQKRGQSRLGDSQVVVLTCRRDNQSAGHSFEGQVARLERQLVRSPDDSCLFHQQTRTTSSGLLVSTDPQPYQATDVRAAFLIAFATLGYRWVLAPRLDNLRRRLTADELLFAATDFEVICCLGEEAGLAPNHVYEVVEPFPAVLVSGRRHAVVLPCHSSPPVIEGIASYGRTVTQGEVSATAVILKARLGKRWPWPKQYVRPGGDLERTWDDVHGASIFHYDRCENEADHIGYSLRQSEIRLPAGGLYRGGSVPPVP